MNIKFRVELSQSERDQLAALLSGGRHASRKIKRAQILVAADEGFSDEVIAATLNVSGSTIYRTKRRFVEANLEGALSEEARPGVARKLSSKEEALLVATACSAPPPGRARWTLELLADEMVRLTDHDELSSETVRRRLAENHLKPWRKDMWCIPKVDGEYVARMEDVLDLYAEAPDPQRPVICFDESPTQLIGEVRDPIAAKPGQIERYDCEYRRNGTVNLFVFMDAHRPWRRVKVTDRRTNQDFAQCMRELVDLDYPDAPIIRVVMDNLSTHSAGALYDSFPAAEARRVLKRLEFHHTPKHASWLNMVEIEIGVLRSQCLDRRIDNKDSRSSASIIAWQQLARALKSIGCCSPEQEPGVVRVLLVQRREADAGQSPCHLRHLVGPAPAALTTTLGPHHLVVGQPRIPARAGALQGDDLGVGADIAAGRAALVQETLVQGVDVDIHRVEFVQGARQTIADQHRAQRHRVVHAEPAGGYACQGRRAVGDLAEAPQLVGRGEVEATAGAGEADDRRSRPAGRRRRPGCRPSGRGSDRCRSRADQSAADRPVV